MSVECMDRVFRYSKTTKPAERLVLLAIANYANADGTGAYPSIQTLAREAGGVSDRYIKEIIRSLEKLGELIVITGGGNASNRYTVNVWPPQQVSQESPVKPDTPMNHSSPVNQESPVEVNHSSLPSEPGFTPPMNHSSPDPSYKTTPPTEVAAQPNRPLAEQFHGLVEELKITKNRANKLVDIYTLLYGKETAPQHGYILKVANQIGGAGYMAHRLWELSARPPNGDILAYILAEHKGKQQRQKYTNGNHGGDPAIWHKLESTIPDYMQEENDGN